ncbi:uncharacterized protein MONBRDRAFT_22361 [Monosiga brevicollis MX1]|uniref:Crossover junction endonuclease MUS81 n=1 Tax=Monosiga brevicollis TaxID=81824 RepID=A9UQC8_MONBE|nr:uncharacterized protein MONBRDRAFT_22361 [Monosiga brevicollis MX1]EDQ93023.1 predicted protein [Monosiga brevicollis MX1]|eukprot:XP_001742785.1 hypothetical protein [Monosiga brevicollis MX1]
MASQDQDSEAAGASAPSDWKPYFIEWLEELRSAASTRNSTFQRVYSKALKSMQAHPGTLQNGKDAMQLKGVGAGIARLLDEKKASLCTKRGTSRPGSTSTDTQGTAASTDAASGADGGPRRKRATRAYVPRRGSGAAALLIGYFGALTQSGGELEYLSKRDLIAVAQPYSESSFTSSDKMSHYTAWSSMAVLLEKGLFLKYSNPAKFKLTPEGLELGQRLYQARSAARTVDVASPLVTFAGMSNRSAPHDARSQRHPPPRPAEHAPTRPDNHPAPKEPAANAAPQSAESAQAVPPCHICETAPAKIKQTHQRQPLSIPMSPTARTVSPGPMSSTTFDSSFDQLRDAPTPNRQRATPFATFQRLRAASWQLAPREYDIVLVIDSREDNGLAFDRGLMKERLDAMGVRSVAKRLPLGDFLWIVQERITPVPGRLRAPIPRELVLDYVVERKRIDDLVASIRDGRYREQKFRFARSGINRPIYLVENADLIERQTMAGSALKQALVNSQIHEGFFVKTTSNLTQTLTYLALMTRYLQQAYRDTTFANGSTGEQSNHAVELQTYEEFCENSAKNKDLSVRDLFLQHLMCLRGVTVHKATAVVEEFETPANFTRLITQKGKTVACQMISNLNASTNSGKPARVGPAIAKVLVELYSRLTA